MRALAALTCFGRRCDPSDPLAGRGRRPPQRTARRGRRDFRSRAAARSGRPRRGPPPLQKQGADVSFFAIESVEEQFALPAGVPLTAAGKRGRRDTIRIIAALRRFAADLDVVAAFQPYVGVLGAQARLGRNWVLVTGQKPCHRRHLDEKHRGVRRRSCSSPPDTDPVPLLPGRAALGVSVDARHADCRPRIRPSPLVDGWAGRESWRETVACAVSVELLTRTEMSYYLPTSEIRTEYFWRFPKSLIAVQRPLLNPGLTVDRRAAEARRCAG
jgi:hypothetical protein